MKVLYALANYPQASESYIEAEIAYVRSRGVEVEVWSRVEGYGDPPPVPVHRGSVQEAIDAFHPDLVHAHYLVTALDLLRTVSSKIPVTVRAHSFDWSLSAAHQVADFKQVQAIYAFPHFARTSELFGKKIIPLSVAYDAPLYDAPSTFLRARDRVVRLSAGRRVKGLADFLSVARLVNRGGVGPGTFHLAVCSVHGDEGYVAELLRDGPKAGVHVHTNVGRALATEMIRGAGIYLDTSDPAGHPFGMPISIAEALASGCFVLARDCPAVHEYLGACGAVYGSVGEAAKHVLRALKWDYDTWESVGRSARGRARDFRSDVVLPKLVEDWERFVK